MTATTNWFDLCADDSNISMKSDDFRALSKSQVQNDSRSQFDPDFDSSQGAVNLLIKKTIINDENSQSRKRGLSEIDEGDEKDKENARNQGPPKAKHRLNQGGWKASKTGAMNGAVGFGRFLPGKSKNEPTKTISPAFNTVPLSSSGIIPHKRNKRGWETVGAFRGTQKRQAFANISNSVKNHSTRLNVVPPNTQTVKPKGIEAQAAKEAIIKPNLPKKEDVTIPDKFVAKKEKENVDVWNGEPIQLKLGQSCADAIPLKQETFTPRKTLLTCAPILRSKSTPHSKTVVSVPESSVCSPLQPALPVSLNRAKSSSSASASKLKSPFNILWTTPSKFAKDDKDKASDKEVSADAGKEEHKVEKKAKVNEIVPRSYKDRLGSHGVTKKKSITSESEPSVEDSSLTAVCVDVETPVDTCNPTPKPESQPETEFVSLSFSTGRRRRSGNLASRSALKRRRFMRKKQELRRQSTTDTSERESSTSPSVETTISVPNLSENQGKGKEDPDTAEDIAIPIPVTVKSDVVQTQPQPQPSQVPQVEMTDETTDEIMTDERADAGKIAEDISDPMNSRQQESMNATVDEEMRDVSVPALPPSAKEEAVVDTANTASLTSPVVTGVPNGNVASPGGLGFYQQDPSNPSRRLWVPCMPMPHLAISVPSATNNNINPLLNQVSVPSNQSIPNSQVGQATIASPLFVNLGLNNGSMLPPLLNNGPNDERKSPSQSILNSARKMQPLHMGGQGLNPSLPFWFSPMGQMNSPPPAPGPNFSLPLQPPAGTDTSNANNPPPFINPNLFSIPNVSSLGVPTPPMSPGDQLQALFNLTAPSTNNSNSIPNLANSVSNWSNAGSSVAMGTNASLTSLQALLPNPMATAQNIATDPLMNTTPTAMLGINTYLSAVTGSAANPHMPQYPLAQSSESRTTPTDSRLGDESSAPNNHISVWDGIQQQPKQGKISWAEKLFPEERERNKHLKALEEQNAVKSRKAEVQLEKENERIMPVSKWKRRRPQNWFAYGPNEKNGTSHHNGSRSSSVSHGKPPRPSHKRSESVSRETERQSRDTSVSVECRSQTPAVPVEPEKLTQQRIAKRVEMIAKGKNTIGYKKYLKMFPKNKRKRACHPSTPDPSEKISKRRFMGKLQAWRKALHTYDESLVELSSDEMNSEAVQSHLEESEQPSSNHTSLQDELTIVSSESLDSMEDN